MKIFIPGNKVRRHKINLLLEFPINLKLFRLYRKIMNIDLHDLV